MRCRTAERYISLKLDGELHAKTEQKLAHHLQRCNSCRAMLEATKAMQEQLLNLDAAQYPSWMHQRIMHNLPQKTSGIRFLRPVYSYAASAFAVALSFYIGTLAGIHGFQKSSYLADSPQNESIQLSFGENSLMEMYNE